MPPEDILQPGDSHLPSVAQREASGLADRERAPLASLGDYAPAPARPDPVALLQDQAQSRVPELVPVRYGRMLASPFTFYRGAALIMASDLSSGPRSPMQAQLCGDAHLSNFGAFASPERHLIFDINDFDETNPGPFEWDVKRLVTSFEVAGRERGFAKKERNELLRSTTEGYLTTMHALAAQGNLDVWYATLDVDSMLQTLRPHLDKSARKQSGKRLAKARSRNSLQAADKLTRVVDGARRFIDDPPVIERAETLLARTDADAASVTEAMPGAWQQYADSLPPDRQHLLAGYEFVDLARKVVGVGSVGTRAWVLLMQGRDTADLLLLQIKEAQASVLEAFTEPSAYRQHGERVVQGQRLLQSASDIFLGWSHLLGTDYYLRQLRDWKVSVDVDTLDPAGLALYGRICGATLAKGHARTGDRVAIAAYLGDDNVFHDAMKSFARAYAEQNEIDYAAFTAAVDSGRITAHTGV